MHALRILSITLCLMAVAGSVRAETVIGATKTGLLVWIAEELGYFEDVPGGVRIVSYQSGTAAAQDLLSGKVDLSTSSEFAFGSNALKHADLRVVAALSSSRTCRLFGRRDRGVESIRDLRGKRVGVTLKGIGQFFLGQSLVLAGVALSDVELVDMKPLEIVAALDKGRIDAGITWEPYVFQAKQGAGESFVYLDTDNTRYFYFLLIGRLEGLKRKQFSMAGIVAALKRAEQFAKENPDKAIGIIRDRFGLEEDYIRQLWPQHTLRVSLPQDLLFVIEEGIRWRIEEGLVGSSATMPDVGALVHLPPLEQVSPGDISIIR